MNTQVNDPKGAAGALKAPMHLIPPYALEQTAWVHKLGSEKYGAYNWRKTGVCATTYVSAIIRHLDAWRDGQDMDPESGISHIAHIATSCNILLDAGHCGTLQDDRNKKPVLNTFAAAVAKAEAEAVKGASVAMDQRDLPIPSEWTLPPIPEGYNRWVYRGTFESNTIAAINRFIAYSYVGKSWTKTSHLSGSHHHLEAVKDESASRNVDSFCIVHGCVNRRHQGRFIGDLCAPCHAYITSGRVGPTASFLGKLNGLPPYPPVPKGYDRWVYRGKGWKTDRKVYFAATTSPYIEWGVYKNGCTVGYESTHYIEAVKD